MKLSTLEKVKLTLEHFNNEVIVPTQEIEKARLSLQRMMAISSDQTVSWPKLFQLP